MDKSKHKVTPLFTKLVEYANSHTYPFDVPGHRMGRFDSQFKEVIGEMALKMDVNAPKGLDSLGHPKGVIAEAQKLLADAYDADEAFFLVNGSSVGILTMIMATCVAEDVIIMPRNVHKSAINGLILSGAIPVFVSPDIDSEVGIANGVPFEVYKKAIDENPEARTVFIINPTYFGVSTEIKKIVDYAHTKDMIVVVDEAHGSHFPFSPHFPVHGMKVGADLSVCSIHKTSGSLTQSSALFLKGQRITKNKVQTILNILQSTSPNYLLMSSLDVARQKLVLEGEEIFDKAVKLADFCRRELGKIKGIKILGKEYFHQRGFSQYDHSKIVVKVNELGLSGFEIFQILKEKYQVQAELAEANVVLFIFGIGIEKESVDYLIKTFRELSKQYYGVNEPFQAQLQAFNYPTYAIRPRDAFHAPKKFIPLLDSLGEISGESIMIYPPGIPLVVPGEIINKEVIQLFKFYETQDTITLTDNNDGLIKIVDKDRAGDLT